MKYPLKFKDIGLSSHVYLSQEKGLEYIKKWMTITMNKIYEQQGQLDYFLFFINDKLQIHLEIIPPQQLSTPEGKEEIRKKIKIICSYQNVIAGGINDFLNYNKKNKNKQPVIISIFSTATKTTLGNTLNDTTINKMFSSLFE
ncbi:MAG TPA: hypothetical protein PLD95_02040 [bacterium]|jgi:hypothetical protein|nr:MAG: hypothetical protein BWX59_01600 [Bacteroidetes bacterium ADurb.Bin028]HOG38229.1 hypothetical protein [bacterium]